MGRLLPETSEVRLRRAIVRTVEAVEACQPEYGPNSWRDWGTSTDNCAETQIG